MDPCRAPKETDLAVTNPGQLPCFCPLLPKGSQRSELLSATPDAARVQSRCAQIDREVLLVSQFCQKEEPQEEGAASVGTCPALALAAFSRPLEVKGESFPLPDPSSAGFALWLLDSV